MQIEMFEHFRSLDAIRVLSAQSFHFAVEDYGEETY